MIKNGIKAKLIHFPERSSAIGQVINSYLTNAQDLPDEVIHLMFSANRWEHIKSIREELLAGTTLICDRYAYSGAAYTVAKGLDFNWCCAPDRGLIKPDAVFYLKAQPEELISRGSYGDERFVKKYIHIVNKHYYLIVCYAYCCSYEKLEFQRKVAEVFDKFCSQESSYWHEFDAGKSVEELQKHIVEKRKRCCHKSQSNRWRSWSDLRLWRLCRRYHLYLRCKINSRD